jgi:tetratricopeptide (TPR) repeat protein
MPRKSKDGVVTEIDRTKAKGHLRTAEARMRHGKWGEAREFILQAIEQVPEDTSYQIIEIFCRGVMKSITYVEAAALIEALETDTARQHAEKYFRSGWLYKLSGNTKKARDRFNKALAHDPNHVDSSREFRMLGKRSADAESKRRKEESQLPFARFFKKKK